MDVLQLIRGVRSREPLWDRKHKYYHDRTVTMALWDDVAFALGVDSETARTKWKGLRDTFRGELRKLHKTVMSGKPRTSTNWEYFEEMMFVKDQIYSNKRHLEEMVKKAGSFSIPASNTTDDSNSCDQSKVNYAVKAELPEGGFLENGKSAPSLPENLSTSVPSEDEIASTVATESQERLLGVAQNCQNKRTKLNPESTIPNRNSSPERALDDEDFNFLMSLLPQMRCLPTTRNLYVRLKIQELLYKEMVTMPISMEVGTNRIHH